MCTKDVPILYYIGSMYEGGESLKKQRNWPHILVRRGAHGLLKEPIAHILAGKAKLSQ